MSGNKMGTYFLPQVGDEVLVAFERATSSISSSSARFGTARHRRRKTMATATTTAA